MNTQTAHVLALEFGLVPDSARTGLATQLAERIARNEFRMATGFLGMNLIAAGEAPLATKLLYFVLVFIPVAAITLYTVMKSKPLSDLLEALSDERVSLRAKLGVLLDVWKKKPRR